jgi:hypothetical protein
VIIELCLNMDVGVQQVKSVNHGIYLVISPLCGIQHSLLVLLIMLLQFIEIEIVGLVVLECLPR